MQIRCIRPFSQHQPAHPDEEGNEVPADVVEIPDGAAFDPFHYELATAGDPSPPAPEPAAAALPRLPAPLKET